MEFGNPSKPNNVYTSKEVSEIAKLTLKSVYKNI